MNAAGVEVKYILPDMPHLPDMPNLPLIGPFMQFSDVLVSQLDATAREVLEARGSCCEVV